MVFNKEKCAMLYYEKRKKTNNGWIRRVKSRKKSKRLKKKRKHTGIWKIWQRSSSNKWRRKAKTVSPMNEKTSRNQALLQKFHQEVNHQCCTPCKIPGYMHNPTPVLENNTQIRWDSDIHMDNIILARRPDQIIINKKKENLQICRLCCPRWPQNKTKRMWKEG